MSGSDAASLLQRGIAQQLAGQHKAAIQIFRIVLKRGGDDAAVRCRLGLSLEAIGDLAAADEAYQAAIARDPDLSAAYRQAADMALRARALATRVGQTATADELGRGACWYVAGLGARLMRRGVWDEAIAAYREARALQPGDWAVHLQLGRCLVQTRRFRAAEDALREALRLAPGEVAIPYELGVALYQAGRADEAEASWRQALALDPSNAPTLAALEEARQARETPEHN